MGNEPIFAWVFIVLAVGAGLGLVFVRVDKEKLRASVHSFPGFSLYRFPAFRYGAAIVCLALAAAVYFTRLA